MVYSPLFVIVDVVEHQFQLLLREVFVDGEHHVAELFLVDAVVLIGVEDLHYVTLVDLVVFDCSLQC